MRKANDQKINEVLADLLKAYRLEGKYAEAMVIGAWPEIMGLAVANRTTELRFSEGKLFVTINSASLRQELFIAKEKIIQLLNEAAGSAAVKEIVFR